MLPSLKYLNFSSAGPSSKTSYSLSVSKITVCGTPISKVVTLYDLPPKFISVSIKLSTSFNGISLDNTVRSYTYNDSFSTNKTFILKANDGKKDFSRSIGFNFLNGRYWGVSNSNTYDSNFVKSLSKELSSSRAKTFTVNCGSGQHIYYCIPSNFGTPTFTVGGFSGGFNKIETIQYTNPSGYTESYDIWKSSNSNLGNTTVVVS